MFQLFFLALLLLGLGSCTDPVPSNQITTTSSIDTVDQTLHFQTQSTLPSDSAQWTIDSIYNTEVEGTTQWRYQYTQATAAHLTSRSLSWTWSQDTSLFRTKGYPYQQSFNWTSEQVVTPKTGGGPAKREAHVYTILIFSPAPLPYSTTVPLFQSILDRLQQNLALSSVYPAPPIGTVPDPAPNVYLRLQAIPTTTGSYAFHYQQPALFEGDVIWQDTTALPIDVDVRTTAENVPPTLYLNDKPAAPDTTKME